MAVKSRFSAVLWLPCSEGIVAQSWPMLVYLPICGLAVERGAGLNHFKEKSYA